MRESHRLAGDLLKVLGSHATRRRSYLDAKRLVAAAAAAHRAVGAARFAVFEPEHNRDVADVRGHLGEPTEATPHYDVVLDALDEATT